MKVSLASVPTKTYVEHVEHLDLVIREMRILDSGHSSGLAPVIAEVADFVAGVLDRYGDAKDETYLAAHSALAAGKAEVDFELDLPAEAADEIEAFLDALERIDDICRREKLLVLPASREVRDLRRRLVADLTGQLRSHG